MSPITGPGLGLGTWPARRARISPHAPALSDGERAVDHAELAGRAARIAGGLAERGVGPGDRVAWLGVNAVATLETCFAAWRLGAVAVPLNYRLAPAEVGYMLDDCGATLLVHGPDADDLVAATAPRIPVVRGVEDLARGPARDDAGAGLDDPAVLLYTSGTTGRPKAAVLTHGNLTWNTVNQLAHVDVCSDERTLCISPLFHCVGLSQVTLPTLFKGGSVELVARFDPAAVLGRIAEAGITSFAAVPTMLQMLCESPSFAGTDLSSLRTVVYGGSPVQERVARAWLERGVALQQGYGMTEASPGCTWRPATVRPRTRRPRSGCRTSSPTSPSSATASSPPSTTSPASCWSAGRTSAPATGTARTRPRRRGAGSGSAPATCSGPARTAGRSPSTGSRT